MLQANASLMDLIVLLFIKFLRASLINPSEPLLGIITNASWIPDAANFSISGFGSLLRSK